jgi:O-6-methylguanine DNA methyltransferase
MEKMVTTNLSSPLGRLRLAATDRGACLVAFAGGRGRDPARPLADQWGCAVTVGTNRHLGQLQEELAAYFRGTLKKFTVPLDLRGTAFQLAVWRGMLKIAYGHTLSYGELARRIGRPQAQRAVGQATGANPLAIVVPCHRVLDSSGRLHGYGGGLRRKRFLLEHEGAWTSTRASRRQDARPALG